MRIGIDARFYQESGVGRYLRNLINNLKLIDKKNEYFIFFLKKDFNDFKDSQNFKKVLADFPWYGFSEQLKFPNLLKKYHLNLVHFPHFNVPVFYKGGFVVTIHDLIHQHFKMKRATTLNPILYGLKHIGYKKVFKSALKNSKQILVPSEYVSNLLISEWGINKQKIHITYEAVDANIIEVVEKITKNEIENIMKKFGIKPPYVFYVGNAHPHKNVEGLIKSFLELKQKHPHLQLVLSGQDHYFWDVIKKHYQHKDIIFTGKVSDIELVGLYANSQLFILPSFEEGFGIPILEAMACNTPVASSNAGSLPEVGGNAAVYFNPKNTADMIEKIDSLLKNQNLRKELVKKGNNRLNLFNWKKLAKQTLEVYESSISS